MDNKDLERRINLLEDIEAIKRLKHQYCAYCDDNYNADGIASLYAEDGVFDAGQLGKLKGPEKIRAFFRDIPKTWRFAAHQVMNPIINVEGEKATGLWRLFQPCTLATSMSEQAAWLIGTYKDDYVKVSGQWKFKLVVFNALRLTPYDKGWVKQPFVNL